MDSDAGHQLMNPRRQKISQQRSQAQPKKQVRRRLHTTKSYHEKPINMAEARREIVAALKFHRATMKQQQQQQQQHLQQQQLKSLPQLEFRAQPSSIPILGSSSTAHNCVSSPSFEFISHSPNLSPFHPQTPLSFYGISNISLPDRPLGLKLNLQEFTESDASTFSNNSSPPFSFSLSATSSTSLSSSSSCSCKSTGILCPELCSLPLGVSEDNSDSAVESVHPVMNRKEMTDIPSIGDQHEMVWNENLNSVQSAWWENLLENMETSSSCQDQMGVGVLDDASCSPPWIPNQEFSSDFALEDEFLLDAFLPCLDIGDIEGMDGEWLL